MQEQASGNDVSSLKRSYRKAAERALRSDDRILGAWQGSSCALVCTDDRAIILKKDNSRPVGVNAYPYHAITSVHVRWGASSLWASLASPLSTEVTLSVGGVQGGPTTRGRASQSLRGMMAMARAPNTLTFIGVKANDRAKEAVDTIQRMIDRARTAQEPRDAALETLTPSTASQSDSVGDLERLAKLYESGALSEDEFRAAKERLLRQ